MFSDSREPRIASSASDPEGQSIDQESGSGGARPKVRPPVANSAGSETRTDQRRPPQTTCVPRFTTPRPNCPVCNADHALHSCGKFLRQTLEQRMRTVAEKELCANCFRRSHDTSQCYIRKCFDCGHAPHNSLLCPKKQGRPAIQSEVNVVGTTSDQTRRS